ncbi:CDP-diacylglycerol--serine O-phosphatidyltransferase [candidate division KSB1 bacterium]|nr:CDP-diacylglycerol--serine O-phosphatidyltransferase [candidate division KSB1 bacterium]
MTAKINPKNRQIIPNVFTAINIFCGFLAIIYVLKADFGKVPIDNNFETAAWLIILAAIFDALDGKIARMTKTYSEFGIEFDSLADVVSFGVAPSLLVYKMYFYRLNEFGIVLSFMPLLFGTIRLARFNIQLTGFDKTGFSGLPIPSAAAGLISFLLFGLNETLVIVDPYQSLYKNFLTPIVVFLCILMVSTIPYETLPKISLKKGWMNILKLCYLLLGIVLIIFYPRLFFFPMVWIFILFGVIRWLILMAKGNGEEDVLPIQ